MDAEARLREAWAQAAPAARDPAFAVAVMEHIERRQMWSDLLNLVLLMLILGVLGWAFAPAIEQVVASGANDLGQLATTSLALALSLVVGIWLAIEVPAPLWRSPTLSRRHRQG